MLDVSLMKNYIEELWSKQKLYRIAREADPSLFDKSDYQIFLGALEELRMARSFAVQDTLVDDSLVLSEADVKINEVQKQIASMKSELYSIKDFVE